MFSSTLAAAAVSGLLTTASLGSATGWQTDYGKALSLAAGQQKPMAVFIAAGGPEKLVTDGKLDLVAAKLLQGYVCLAIDPATPAGKDLAASFKMTEGLVISDKTGGVQALRHDGPVPTAELTGYLTRFSKITAVSTTEYGGRSRPLLNQPYGPGRPVMNTVGNVRTFFSGST